VDFGETSLPNILNRTISIKGSFIFERKSGMKKEGLFPKARIPFTIFIEPSAMMLTGMEFLGDFISHTFAMPIMKT
jgi:hypothetical protein